jgi:hypothetical protein
MYSIAIFSCLLSSAIAFAPSAMRNVPTSTKLMGKSKATPWVNEKSQLVGLPGGEPNFDPAGFSNQIDIRWLREAEIKHGRVAMLAFLGFLANGAGLTLPDHNFGVLEAHDIAVKDGAMWQILTFCTALEFIGIVALKETMQGKREPGDFAFDPLNLSSKKSEAELTKLKTQEIKNGRLAMLAFSGIVTQSALTHGAFPYTS